MRADILSQFVDQRIEISGAFDKMTQVNRSGRFIYTALLQDVFAYIDGKEYDVGHVWVQHTEELKPLRLLPGERIQCNCRVKQYKKHLDMPNQDGFLALHDANVFGDSLINHPVALSFVSKLNSLCRMTPSRELAALGAIDQIAAGESVEYEVIPV